MSHSRECATRDVVLKISNEVVLKKAGRSLFSWFAGLLKIKAADIGNVLAAGLTDISKGPDKRTLLSLDIEDASAARLHKAGLAETVPRHLRASFSCCAKDPL